MAALKFKLAQSAERSLTSSADAIGNIYIYDAQQFVHVWNECQTQRATRTYIWKRGQQRRWIPHCRLVYTQDSYDLSNLRILIILWPCLFKTNFLFFFLRSEDFIWRNSERRVLIIFSSFILYYGQPKRGNFRAPGTLPWLRFCPALPFYHSIHKLHGVSKTELFFSLRMCISQGHHPFTSDETYSIQSPVNYQHNVSSRKTEYTPLLERWAWD